MITSSMGTEIGRALPRAATRRLVAGRGRYVDDFSLKGELQAAFLRSPYPHARFRIVDVAQASALPGVARILTADDIDAVCPPWTCKLRNAPDMNSPPQRALAKDYAVFQGEAVAMVVAELRAIAEDALELIAIEWTRCRPQPRLKRR